MNRDVYFRQDIASILAGLVVALIETHLANGAANVEHVNGILTLARGISLAFGVDWARLLAQVRLTLGADLSEVLDQEDPGPLPGCETLLARGSHRS